MSTTMEKDPRLTETDRSFGGYVTSAGRRIASGDLGSLPVIVGLVVTWIIFTLLNDRFLSALNITNLMLQIAATGTIAVGVTFVLLLGEIDLSVGSVSGVTSAILAVLITRSGWGNGPAVVAAVVVGVLIGLIHGTLFTKARMPAFVVTLAGLIGWQGLQLYVLGQGGSINIPDGPVTALTDQFLVPAYGWGLAAICVLGFGAVQFTRRTARSRAGLPTGDVTLLILQIVGLAVVLGVTVLVLNADRGVPMVILVYLVIIVVCAFLLRRTSFGRHLFAVGGNIEAARRAGIRVDAVRIAAFTISSALAAVGGILAASRLTAVTQSSGGGDVLLYAIAAAVIGGTSLFGGRGSVWSALLGMIVIGSITNGLDLLSVSSAVRFMVIGLVLVVAVLLDSLSRRGQPQRR
ncbi:MAG: sugar ABC transporter permease [Streptosporangiales bacterium]|nr:sugar ABC transporter permease [Streptosporangiales bacterium]MBO0892647.1 sugar ABC transporter permease [Acidothermales bacterium]